MKTTNEKTTKRLIPIYKTQRRKVKTEQDETRTIRSIRRSYYTCGTRRVGHALYDKSHSMMMVTRLEDGIIVVVINEINSSSFVKQIFPFVIPNS